MLALKQALSLVSMRKLGGAWTPADETSLVAWFENQVGITLNGSDVSSWGDKAPGNLYDMVQTANVSRQPAYSGGVLTFVSAALTNLQSAEQISLVGDFTLGIRINTSTTNGAFLADNTSSNEFFKYATPSRILCKIAGSASTALDLDSGTFGDDYLVITRASDVLTLYKNGVAQTGTTPTLAGTSLIDVIGVRESNKNALDGTIKEIQIYSSSSADLIANINDRLSTL